MTAPLTPPECDLRGLTFMPLEVGRLRDSDLSLLATGDEFKASVLLWCASWHQWPAASLPSDERVLCRLSGLDAKAWKRSRAGALRGWVLCNDGRLYHPVVAEKAIDAWRDRLAYRKKRDADRERLKGWRDKKHEVGGDGNEPETPVETLPETRFETPKREKGEWSGVESISSVPTGTGVPPIVEEPIDPLTEIRALPLAKGCWRLAVHVLTERGRVADAKARTLVGKLKGGGLTDEDLWSIAEAAWNLGTLDPVAYFAKAAEEAIARRGSAGSITGPSERQQRAWMEDWEAKGAPGWRAHERGPRPDEQGCRVSPAVLAEFGFGAANVVALGRKGAA